MYCLNIFGNYLKLFEISSHTIDTGLVGVIVGHPLDTVKVNIQVKNSINPNYSGTLIALRTLLNHGGIRSLYRGATSPLIGFSAVNAVTFGVYHSIYNIMPSSHSTVLIAGGTAGFLGSFILSPIELAKSRLQVAGHRAGKNPLDTLLRLYRHEGFRGIFRGTGITIMREVPANMTYFIVYDWFTQPVENSSTAVMFVSGGVAGIASWVVPYPADVIKSKTQVDGLLTERMYTSSYDCLIKVIKTEGVLKLYAGLVPTMLRAFPVNSLMFAVVSWLRFLYNKNTDISSEVSHIRGKCPFLFRG